MEKQKNMETGNPLGELSIPRLLLKFTVPSIIAMLTSALYNIVDQFFIGNSVGELGNAATNIAFPLTTCCLSIALLFGIGGASAFNLAKGGGGCGLLHGKRPNGHGVPGLYPPGFYPAFPFPHAGVFWHSGQRDGVCKILCEDNFLGISHDDSCHRGRPFNPGGRKP